ncbi:MAG: hypothetical protein ACK5Z3_23185, partial [Pseudanabaena sp.]
RDFQAMAERTGASQEIGTALLKRSYRLFHWWHRVRNGTLSKALFIKAVELLRVGMHQECPPQLSKLALKKNLPSLKHYGLAENY